MMQGQIIEGRGGLYTVRDAAGIDHVLRAKKKFRRQHMTPLVGDRVDFTPGEGDEHGWLEEILPRSSQCLRPPVANITLLVIVAAVAPAPDWLLIDKLLLGGDGITLGVMITVCITMAVTVLCAKLVGGTLPIVAEKLGFDPAVMASPFITTIVDALSLLLYFQVATALLQL